MESTQIETGLSQQPMSLITINSNINNKRNAGSNDENLLTIRILEASERKMQLIKKLLSPEEFDSIASELQNVNKQDVRYLQRQQKHIQTATNSDQEIFSGSIPVQFKDNTGYHLKEEQQVFDKRLSKSESNICTNCNFNLHDNISRKREGLEFFFSESESDNQDNPVKIVQESRDLAIELRSGYYMNSSSSEEEESGNEIVLKSFGFSLKDIINGLLSYLNLSSLNIFSIEEDEEFEQSEFIKLNRKLDRKPYTTKRNLLKMNKRLKVENEFDKVNNLTHKMFETTQTKVEERRERGIQDIKELNLDRNHKIMVDFNSIGHSFSSLRSMSSKQFESLELFDILNYPESFEWLFRSHKQNRLNLSSYETELVTNHRVLILSLSSIEMIKHNLVLPEESLAIKLLNCQSRINKVQDVFDCVTERLIEIIDEIDSNRVILDEINRRRLKAMLDLRGQVLMNQLKSLENELKELYSELETIRKQQNFRSTGILMRHHYDVEEGRKTRYKLFKDSLGKLIKLMSSDGERSGADDGFSREFIEQQIKLDFVGIFYRIDEFGSQITDNNRCPREEYQRRLNLKRWLRSLRIRILFGNKFFQECTVRFQSPNYFIKLDLSKNNFHVPIPANESEISIKIEILAKRHSLIPFYQDLIATSKSKLVISGVKSIDKLKLQFLDKQTEIDMNFCRLIEGPRSFKTRFNYCARQFVDAIYKKTFINSTIFDDLNIKIFKLLNQTDLRYLILFLHQNKPVIPHFNSSFFALNPYLDHFVEEDTKEANDNNNGSIRQALLVWRWLNNINQTVYLSDRENNKYHDLNKLQEIDSKLRLISATKLESGYKAIEQIRLFAIDYIKKYECHLNEILQFNNEIFTKQHKNISTNLRDLLQEPRIKIDLSGLVNLFQHKFVPRRTARRPLMPKRSKKGMFGVKNIQQDLVQESSGGDKSETLDLESQVFDHWQRFTSRMRFSQKLQLVVTIQQANNVPMRVRQQQQQQSVTTRSNTPQPFAITSTTTGPATGPSISPSNFFNLASSNINTQTSLEAPTSYVEVIFQRKQQASSLVYGKNPNWHETLFFPVDVPKTSYLNSQSPLNFHLDGNDNTTNNTNNENVNLKSHGQLVDEFLQLNLYDYNCYLHNDTMMINSHTQLPTLPLTSQRPDAESGPAGGLLDSSLQSNRMLASRQRIERHLLGSLRVPLKTLLSTGRIEGSFALNQPLFMENYQFEPEQTNNNISTSTIINTQQARDSNFKRNNKFETYISLFITLDPPISIPFYFYLSTGSHESEQIFKYAKLWERTISQYKKRVSKQRSTNLQASSAISLGGSHYHIRHVRAIVLQLDAKYCLVSRLITPLRPPKELLIESGGANKSRISQMKTLARFVSLLSPLKYGLFNMRLLASSLWFDSTQLINKYLGGIEEKAVLLCNYFLYLGHCSAVLLGDAIPEGRCAYVIVWHEQSRLLDEQLQLNADNLLLESLAGEGGETLANNKQQNEPVMSQNFLLNLPILINSKTVHLWDPNSGKSYTLNDSLQLISVGSIVTCENVYANIQAVESVTGTNFDIRLKNFWFPLFEGSSSSQNRLGDNFRKNYLKRTNQMNLRRQLVELEETRRLIGKVVIKPVIRNEFVQLNYDKLTEEQCKHLEDSIDRAIKAQLLKWRPSRPTYFNRTLSRHLAEKLKLFERYSIDQANLSNNSSSVDQQTVDWKSELADLIRNEILMPHISSNGLNARQVVSWPMNLSFTSMKTILDSLYASGVHNADVMLESASSWNMNQGVITSTQPTLSISSNTQFLVACHAHAYPARVVSVWLYVAAVITQNRPLLT